MSHKRILKRILYVGAILMLQEVLFRFFFPVPSISNFDRINYMLLAERENEYRHLQHQTWTWQSDLDTSAVFKHYMNGYGFRDSQWRVNRGGRERYLFIGDSFVEGVMAAQEETIPVGFASEVPAEAEVWNGGMMGAGLPSYLQLFADAIPIFKPNYVFFCISTNDLSGTEIKAPSYFLSPKFHSRWQPRLFLLISRIRNKNPIKFRWHFGNTSYLPTEKDISSPWYRRRAELESQTTPELATAMRMGTLSPFRVNNLYNEERHLRDSIDLGECLGFLKYFCNEYDVSPVVVYIPSRNLVSTAYLPYERALCLQKCRGVYDLTEEVYQEHQKIVATGCEQLNIPYINLTNFIRQEESGGERLYWNYDDHMRGSAYLKVGKEIYRQWQNLRGRSIR